MSVPRGFPRRPSVGSRRVSVDNIEADDPFDLSSESNLDTNGSPQPPTAAVMNLAASPPARRISASPTSASPGVVGSVPIAWSSPPPSAPMNRTFSTTKRSNATNSNSAPSSITGQAHLAALLQRMGKTLERRTPSSATSINSSNPNSNVLPHSSSIASSTAFDAAVRSNALAAPARADLLKELKYDLEEDDRGRSSSSLRFLGHDERLTLEDMMDDNAFLLESPEGSPRGKAQKDEPMREKRSSPRIQQKVAGSQVQTQSQSTNSSRANSPSRTAVASAPKRSTSNLQPRTLTSSFSYSSTSSRTSIFPPTKSVVAESIVYMEDISQAATQPDDDDDPDAPFTFAADGLVAKEQAAQLEVEKKKAASRALAASMKRKRSTTETSNSPAAKRPSPAKPASKSTPFPSPSVSRSGSQDEDPFAVQFTPSPKPSLPVASPPPTAVPPEAPTPTAAKHALRKTPSKQPSYVFEADPFEIPDSPPVTRSPSVSVQSSQRTVSAPTLPAHVAVGLMGLVPAKKPTPPSSSNGSTPNPASTDPNDPTLAGRGSPSLSRANSAGTSELLEQRRANLAQKSHTALLLEALLGKSSPELKEIEQHALTPAQRVLLQKRPSAPVSYVTLAAKMGRKLKPKVGGQGVGYNAKQRSRGRRADGFLADMNPVLEKVVEYLLDQGADPNGRDADRNHALWLALQLRGSERVVKLLLDKGAECVMAEESEDESSSDEEDASERKKQQKPVPNSSPKQQKDPVRPDLLSQAAASVTDPSVPSGSKHDPLTYERGSTVDLAMKMGSERLVLMLLRAGHMPSRMGPIPLMPFARLHKFADEAASMLIENLWFAVKDADPYRVADVLKHIDKAMVDAKDPTGRTPLYHAVEQKDPSLPIVNLLLRCGANPNQVDCSNTPMAVFPLCRQAKKSTDILILLARYGLDPNLLVGDSGQTLVEFAQEASARPESIQLLQTMQQKDAQAKQRKTELVEASKLFHTSQDPFKFDL